MLGKRLNKTEKVKMEYRSLVEEMKDAVPSVNSIDIRTIAPLTLAYVGDSVMDLFVRTYLATSCNETVSKLNSRAIKIVRASAQAELVRSLDDFLTEEEKDVLRRGRNAKSATMPKNADMTDYRLATGLEALLGYLFILGRTQRLCELFAEAKRILFLNRGTTDNK